MTIEEKWRVGVFVLALISVFTGAAWLGVRAGLRWALRRPPFADALERRVSLAFFSIATVGLACVLYGWQIEPYWLDVTRIRVASSKLAPSARPLRIAHLSDLHSDPKPRLEEGLPAAIEALAPDLIVFTGDAVNSEEGLPVFKRLMSRLAVIARVYAVRGDWDSWMWPHLDLYGGTGVRELKTEAVRLEVGGTPVWLAGLPADQGHRLRTLLAEDRAGGLGILLHHFPDEIYAAAASGVDLYLAGHTHGGQVALPFYGALVTLSRWGKRFEAGLYEVDRTWLYVNRGIGMDPTSPVRFWARPELTLIEVVASARVPDK